MEDLVQVYDGGSGEWLWYRQDGEKYYFIRIIDLVEFMGKEATDYWDAEVALVDLADPGVQASWDSAYDSSGYDDMGEEILPGVVAHILYEYGTKSPLWGKYGGTVSEDDPDPRDEDDDDFKELFAEAVRVVEECLLEPDKLEAKLNVVVNGLGQTAREYARGTAGLFDKLREIKNNNEATPEQQLVLKLYGACEHTLGGDVIPEDLRR